MNDNFDKIEKDASGKVDKTKLLEHISDKQEDNVVGNAPPAAVQRNTVDHVKRKYDAKILAL